MIRFLGTTAAVVAKSQCNIYLRYLVVKKKEGEIKMILMNSNSLTMLFWERVLNEGSGGVTSAQRYL